MADPGGNARPPRNPSPQGVPDRELNSAAFLSNEEGLLRARNRSIVVDIRAKRETLRIG
jgi:hypothetical protein